MLASSTLDAALAADAASMLSPAALARTTGSTGGATPSPSQILANPALQAQRALSAANLARAAADLSALNAAQAAASASSQLTLGNVALSGSAWNGAALSGLNPRDTDPTLWIGADALHKDQASATATVKQTAATALLTWQSFDINKGEKLVFDQQGNADWSVLNRIVAGPRDANGSRFVASPSRILGSIEAPGSVYVINPNGVVFGPTAQVNVHSFIASSLDVGNPSMSIAERNSFFLNTGFLGAGGNIPAESFSYNPADTKIEGDIVVQAGAKITASLAPRSVSPDAGGFVYLFAPNVENRGTISTPAGETLMVAAQAVQLIANGYPDGFAAEDSQKAFGTFRAVGINSNLFGGQIDNGGLITTRPIIWRTDGPASAQISAPGQVTNSGLISAERGVVILNGDLVTNGSSGIIQANTSVTRNGQIFLDARLKLTLGGGSIQILPTENGETIPASALPNFAPGKVEMRGLMIDMEPGSLIEAPGATVTMTGANSSNTGIYPEDLKNSLAGVYFSRVYMAPDSAIDVSGLQDVQRPMSDNFLTFKPFGNEFADQPLQRNGALRGQELTVDLRQTGILNGTSWVGTPLANLQGYANSVQSNIDQLLTTGGNVTLTTGNVPGQIVLRQGSSINIGGGSVQYTGDTISATKLLTADGRIVSISRADPLDSYAGIAGVTQLLHPHWGATTTQTFSTPLLDTAAPEPGYTEGHDAGAVTLSAAAYVLEGAYYGGVIAGDRQRGTGQKPSAGDSSTAMPTAGSFQISGINNLVVSENITPLAGTFDVMTPLPDAAKKTTALSAQKLSDAGFAKISAAFSGSLKVTSDANLVAAPGGAIKLSGGSADIEGRLVTHSGSIQVESTANISGDTGSDRTAFVPTIPVRPHDFDLVVGAAALLDVSGLWVNDDGASAADLAGGAFVDGGSIDLRTDSRSAQCFAAICKTLAGLGLGVDPIVDLTGDIVLNKGALLDVSSGGRITDRGFIQLDAAGRAVGKGGNVLLGTYFGAFSTSGAPLPVTTSALTAGLRLPSSDGSAPGNAAALSQAISAYGFSQGGTLALQAPSLDIGAVAPTSAGEFALSAGFFDGNAFSNYSLAAVADHLSVAPGTAVVLRQRNLVPQSELATLQTGAKVSQATSVDTLPDFIRQPVNLNLAATVPVINAGPFDPETPVPPSKVVLSVGQGASIAADPGANIVLSVTGRTPYEGGQSSGTFIPAIAGQTAVAEILGSISAPGGNISLSAPQNSTIWLGAASRLSASGAALTDNRQTLFRTGKVLPGGSVTITGADATSSVVGLSGARIDVSGSSGVFDLLADSGPTTSGQQRIATVIGSDAGSIAITAPTLLYDGAFAAHPGTDTGNGGSLTIISPAGNAVGGEIITVRQSGNSLPPGLKSTDPLDPPQSIDPVGAPQPADPIVGMPTDTPAKLTGSVVFFADRLAGSGIQNLTLSMGPVTGDTVGSQGNFAPGTLAFSGNVSLGGLAHLYLDASQIKLVNPVALTDPTATCNVCLSAGYIALRGAGNPNKVVSLPGKGVLQISAGTIDIAAGGFSPFNGTSFEPTNRSNLLAISGAALTRFVSTGDIRLRVPLANAPLDLTPGSLPAGELVTAGDLTFTAAQIYPVSAVDFTLKSIAPKGTISFAANGGPQEPTLSAGGQLTVSAATINQSGILRAPLGTIRLGAQVGADLSPSDPLPDQVIATSAVTLGAGSITSVSLSGATVPYGQTANGTSWSYDSFTGVPLTAPPAKNLTINAAGIKLAANATLDVTGGGDLQAIEFVPGTGGSRDVLAGANTYAIIPGVDPAAAPIDLDFLLQRNDALPLAGSRVYLSGQAGLVAGYYTLLPAHYASLPGAYRVSLTAGSGDAVTSRNAPLPDGTLRMAGYFYNATSDTRSARLQYFDVQSSNTWRQYSEIDQTSGNSFFGAKTSGVSGLAPRLPVDAGRAMFSASNAIDLSGQIIFTPGDGGRGGELDIAAQDIQVLSPGKTARAGYVGLDATRLSNLGFDSLLLGGVRNDTPDGQVVTVAANSVELSNDAGAPLEGPEIILVTNVGSGAVDPNAGRAMMLDAGSVLRARGSVVDPRQKTLIIGVDTDDLKINGNGSLVAVSNGSTLAVQRRRATQTNGNITFADPAAGTAGPGANISGNSITLDTTGNIRPGAVATLAAANIALAARSFNFGTTQANIGLNINGSIAAQLAQANNLTLRSGRPIQFSGPVGFSMGTGSHLIMDGSGLVSTFGSGAVGLSAGRIDWINSGTGQTAAAAGTATLNLAASEVHLGLGGKSLSAFGSAAISATSLIAMDGAGSLNAGAANLVFQTPLLLAAAKSNQSVTTTGGFGLAGTGSAAPVTQDQVGGILTLTARSVALGSNANIQAPAGSVTLTATTGDVTLGASAKIQAAGFVSTFFDTMQVVSGGAVQLTANQGSIDADSSALIDVSSAPGQPGYAGQLGLSAANGFIRSNGGAFNMKVIAGTVAGDGGGRLTVDTQSLGTTAISPPPMFDAAIDLRLRQGNIQLASDIRARSVTVTADGGSLTVAHKIDSSGTKGGSISLFGQGVVLTPGAILLATASDATKHGGDVVIGTNGSGVLDLQGGLINVSNTADAAMGGTVRLRAPLTGAAFDDVAMTPVKTVVQGASSVTIEGYRVFNAVDPTKPDYNANTDFNGVIDPLAQPGFYGSCSSSGVCTGTLIDFVQKFALSADAQAKFFGLSAATLHLQPGIELANNSSVNNGDITVANPWNLGSGVSGNLYAGEDFVVKKQVIATAGTQATDENGNLLALFTGYKGSLVFVPGKSQIRNLNYRVGGSLTGEAGMLTLRAARDVNINNSITDGFYNTRNVFDTNYQKSLQNWVNSAYFSGDIITGLTNVNGYLYAGATFANTINANGDAVGPAPLAPYDAGANSVSPTFSGQLGKTRITGADLFALMADPKGAIVGSDGTRYSAVNSWSYRIVGGADTASANPLAVQPLSVFDPAAGGPRAGHGNVTLDGHTQYTVANPNFGNVQIYETPTIVRTGTGSIDIAAGLDFVLADTKAPGVVYTAGRNSVALPDPGFVVQMIDDPVTPGQPLAVPVATNPQGFLTPVAVLCDITSGCNPYGPPTQAAYPVNAGDITLKAQRDIIGFEHPTIGGPGYPNQQYFAPWLLAQGSALPSTNFGPFSPLSGYVSTGAVFTPSQTSWWINFGNFDQGLMSVGGDVIVTAGRDIQELSVSLPTTARVSGGLSSTITDAQGHVAANVPVVHLNPSGDLTVIAGRDLKSGAYYEGSGDATIIVGGSVSASWSQRETLNDPTSAHPVSTILAVDTGKLALEARGNIDIGGIVSGPSLQNVADLGNALNRQSVFGYGPNSAVSLLSAGGDIVTNSLAFDLALVGNIASTLFAQDPSGYQGVSRYPASFRAVAANGDVNVATTFRLTSSQDGSLELLAHGSLLTSSSTVTGRGLQPLSTGASLVEQAFDAANPLIGFAPQPGSVSFDLGSLLLHQDDRASNLFYAATGDIIANESASMFEDVLALPLAWEINKTARVQAARDIIDLSFFGQNLNATDITSITAGRDIVYTGTWQQQLGTTTGIPDLNATQNLGGLSLAGPGFFQVQAGRNLGPFVTAASDIAAGLSGGPFSDPVGTGIVTFGNTVTVGNRRMVSTVDPSTADAFAASANNKLPRQGASIVALFGVAKGVNYSTVLRDYVDPATSTSAHNYLPELVTYLQTLGYPALSQADAWRTFQALPQGLENIFADKVFVSELSRSEAQGYSIVNVLFPTSLGYTDNYGPPDPKNPKNNIADPANAQRFNADGSPKVLDADSGLLSTIPVVQKTGQLDLLHATIKTLQAASTTITNADGTTSNVAVGGDITVLGPGGSINVGTTALEIRDITLTPAPPRSDPYPQNKLSNSSLGILTLDNGAISIFTDADVLVNQSRALTVQGGDILLWSSNGDLDAGRGAKTTVDFKPLSVNFDASNLQTINLNGLVSGAGIGTIQSTPDAPAASAKLIAPRGTVNAGDAGLRSSGNLDILAFLVLNAANISAVGSVSGVPQVNSVNLGTLESASASGGAASQVADAAVAAAAGRGAQNVIRAIPALFSVEVLGFGDCDPEGGKRCSAE